MKKKTPHCPILCHYVVWFHLAFCSPTIDARPYYKLVVFINCKLFLNRFIIIVQKNTNITTIAISGGIIRNVLRFFLIIFMRDNTLFSLMTFRNINNNFDNFKMSVILNCVDIIGSVQCNNKTSIYIRIRIHINSNLNIQEFFKIKIMIQISYKYIIPVYGKVNSYPQAWPEFYSKCCWNVPKVFKKFYFYLFTNNVALKF